MFQDNVFVTVVASIQYRALADKASDSFYKLSNTKEQIQAYVFDGMVYCGKIYDHKAFFIFSACPIILSPVSTLDCFFRCCSSLVLRHDEGSSYYGLVRWSYSM